MCLTVEAVLQAAYLCFETAESFGQVAQNGVAVTLTVIALAPTYEFQAIQVQHSDMLAPAFGQRNQNVRNAFDVVYGHVVTLGMKLSAVGVGVEVVDLERIAHRTAVDKVVEIVRTTVRDGAEVVYS